MKNLLTFSSAVISQKETRKNTVCSSHNKDDIFWFYSQFEKTIALDRFGYANKYSSFNFYNEKPLSSFPSFSNSLSFEECSVIKAKELIEKSEKENKKIAVSYSGGVDSTMVVCILLLCGIKKENLVIIHSASSIDEYPWFFEHLKKEKIKTIPTNNTNIRTVLYLYAKKHILVFGNCGDQLYGSIINLKHPDWFHKDYKDFCRNFGASDNVISQFEDIFSHYNLPIKKTSELLWWLNFSIKHTKVNYKGKELCEKDIDSIAFFNSPHFDNWSCCHFDDKDIALPNEPKYYRPEQKAIIYKYTHDIDYIKTKTKTDSLKLVGFIFNGNHPIIEKDNFLLLKYDELEEYFKIK